MMRRLIVAALVLTTWAVSALTAAAQVVCLSPGEFKNDFTFGTQVVNNSLIKKARTIGPIHLPAEPLDNPSMFGQSTVEFAGPTIRLDAFANRVIGVNFDRQVEAFARGKLFVDFAVDCGSTDNASVMVTLRFQVKRVGRISTFWPGSTTSFGVSARIRDVAENRDLDFRVIDDTSVGNLFGSIKMIAKVPVVVPEIEALSLAKVETFVLQVRKGRVYRLELFAGARSTTGLATVPITLNFARANFREPVELLGNLGAPGIELAGLTMDVGLNPTGTDVQAELSGLRGVVESLREAVASLSAQLEAVTPNMEVLVSDLHDKLAEQDERHARAVEQLRALAEAQTGAVRSMLDALLKEFESHTHDYLTGSGEGHNTTTVITSPPKKKMP